MKLKKLITGETSSIYVVSEAYQYDLDRISNWLKENCPGEYTIDKQYIFITPKYEILFALNFVGMQV